MGAVMAWPPLLPKLLRSVLAHLLGAVLLLGDGDQSVLVGA
jgi:hypothetical protein